MIGLYDFQETAVEEIVDRGGEFSYLGYEMGTGKTPIAIEVMERRKAARVLVICPAVARLVWAKELKTWAPLRKVTQVSSIREYPAMSSEGVCIISYPMLSLKSLDWPAMIGKLAPFDMTVIDEAHYLKNPKANRTKAILKTMRKVLGFTLPMSGSPAPNHAGELYPILASLFPKAIQKSDGKPMTIWEYENAYCQVVNKRFGAGTVRVIEGSKNIENLKGKLNTFMMRKRKVDVLKQLPPLTFDTYPVPIDPRGEHRDLLKAYADVIKPGMSDDEVLKALSINKDAHFMRVRAALGLAKVPGAVELIDDMLEGSSRNRKVVVFAHHKLVIETLTAMLAKYSPVVIVGETSPKARAEAVDKFLNAPDVRVFVGNLTAASTSITLCGPKFDVSDAIFVETSFNLSENVQAAARIHRIGQQSAVLARFVVADGTLDDRIQEIVARKSRDFAQLFDGALAVA